MDNRTLPAASQVFGKRVVDLDRMDLPNWELRQLVDEIAGLKPDILVRPELGHELQFVDLSADFARLIDTAGRLSRLPIEDLPEPVARRAMTAFGQVQEHIRNVREFSLLKVQGSGLDPVSMRNRTLHLMREALNPFYDLIAPVFGMLAAAQLTAPNVESPEAIRVRLAKLFEEGDAATRDRLEKLDALIRLGQDSVRKVAVAGHATHFKGEADKQAATAKGWLWAVGVSAALTIAAAGVNVWYNIEHAATLTATQSAQIIVAKVVLFSLLISATVWCGRVYRAARHNEIVNRHRQHALSSFEAFAHSTSDEATKNAVLIQATQSIFAPQPTGYSSGDSDHAGPAQLIELIRPMASTPPKA